MINLEEIQKLADLARLSVTEDEKRGLQKDIEGILEYVGQIKDMKLKDAEITAEPQNVMRPDAITNDSGAYSEALIKAAPKSQDGYIKVKKIL